MTVAGKINLFINPHKRGNGEVFNTYSTTIASKDENGVYTHLTIDVRFSKDFAPESLAKLNAKYYYVLEIQEGFLTVRTWKDKDGNERKSPVIAVQKAKVTEKKPVAKGDELPF